MAMPQSSRQPFETELEKPYQEIEQFEEKVSLIASKEEGTSTVTEQPMESGKKVYYKVLSGETLFQIAQKHGITVKKLCDLNKISQMAVIYPGQDLLVTF
jgi:LysM repeat protein